jgi:hypothetical protein
MRLDFRHNQVDRHNPVTHAETASLSLIGVCGESEDKADATASCLYKQENQRNPRECWSFKAFAESHDVWPHVLHVSCSSTGCMIAEATLVFPRSFSPTTTIGVPVVRSRRRLHRLWAGSKSPLPGDGLCTILRHRLLRHTTLAHPVESACWSRKSNYADLYPKMR